MLLDLSMPELSGRALLDRVTADHPDVPVIVLTATNDLDTAVACMQAGAKDYLVKPVEASRLISALKRVIEMRALEAELLSLKARVLEETPHERSAFTDIVTHDRSMFAIFRYLEAIAPSPQPVLITGETGTGKELVARALHRLSGRSGDLVTVNTAGLDDTLFTDTLFGHTRGAFTGADRPREGLVSVAGDGTLFLDEIGDLAMASQVKLLRLLQDGGYYPLGADRPRQCRARIIVATNRDVAPRGRGRDLSERPVLSAPHPSFRPATAARASRRSAAARGAFRRACREHAGQAGALLFPLRSTRCSGSTRFRETCASSKRWCSMRWREAEGIGAGAPEFQGGHRCDLASG